MDTTPEAKRDNLVSVNSSFFGTGIIDLTNEELDGLKQSGFVDNAGVVFGNSWGNLIFGTEHRLNTSGFNFVYRIMATDYVAPDIQGGLRR